MKNFFNAFRDIKNFHSLNKISQFHSVSADILHDRPADASRNKRKVFQAADIFWNQISDKIIPNDAGIGYNQKMIFISFDFIISIIEFNH